MSQPDVFQIIADPNRRQILQLLTQSPMSINRIAENFDMSRPAISKHLKLMSAGGMISIEDSGRERLCSLNPHGFDEIRQWLRFYDRYWSDQLKALGELMDEEHFNDAKQ